MKQGLVFAKALPIERLRHANGEHYGQSPQVIDSAHWESLTRKEPIDRDRARESLRMFEGQPEGHCPALALASDEDSGRTDVEILTDESNCVEYPLLSLLDVV